MDYLRSGYETFMQTWQDDPSLTRVRWFRAAPDAKFFAKEHLFGSQKTWDRGRMNPPDHPGESGYVGWTNSANPAGYQGGHHCGSDSAMSLGGVHGVDPVIETDAAGNAPCCQGLVATPCFLPGYPTVVQLSLTSLFGYCDCGDGTIVPLVYAGQVVDFVLGESDRWYGPSDGAPPYLWGDCVWSDGSGGEGPARFDVEMLLPRAGFASCTFHLRIRRYADSPPGVYVLRQTHFIAMSKLADNPLTLATGMLFGLAGPLCGSRTGLNPGAQMRVDVTGPLVVP